ncbi:hypothetical protein VTK73DRAFT_4173 [Phialemonium thermophilum]|uniref:Cell division cycle protein 123 n=1 Tax=Phialemonium thermophilum TaxID=223376 RepID=A0ABR3Y0M5_9PEZI
MPSIDVPSQAQPSEASRFPPVSRDHILHCSYDYWFPKYRSSCIRSRIIQLPPEFVDYIREDRIILADDDDNGGEDADEEDDWEPTCSTNTHAFPATDDAVLSDSEDEAPAQLPPNKRFPELHKTINEKIRELGGAVAPKLNWSAPKDAVWISPHQNTMKCTSANDIYLLLKSSSFISHDLDHAFDSCSSSATLSTTNNDASGLQFKPVLVLRSFFSPLPSLEFRCFVKHRTLVGITQRDLNHYAFLESLRPAIIARVRELFNRKLRFTFPEESFAFDVYIPEADYREDEEPNNRLGRARLIDINPWAPHTDTLLFTWDELLDLRVPNPVIAFTSTRTSEETSTSEEEDDDEVQYEPELRLIEKDDPAAHNFSTPQYSAHKLPKEVVDASMAGEGGMREFAQQWRDLVNGNGR